MVSQSAPLVSGAELRSEARRIENALDAKLVLFARLAGGAEEESKPAGGGGAGGGSGSGPRPVSEVQHEIEGMLLQLGEVNDRMSRHYTTGGGGNASVTTSRHVLQRHREILHDLNQEFAKIKTNLRSAEERQELLSTVRADIREHRTSTETLLRERNAIHASDRMVSDVISQAEATKQALAGQRSVFGSVGSKLQMLSSLAPKVNTLISAVESKKLRDKMVLGVVVGLCISFILLYSWANS